MGVRGRIARAGGRLDWSVAAVVFTVPDQRLREMDVSAGPCVPADGRKRPLVGVTRQEAGESPEHTAALYTALIGEPSDGALELLEREGNGSLWHFSDAFVRAMADAHRELLALADEDEARGDRRDYPTFMRRREEISAAWLAAGPWPRNAVSVADRLSHLSWAAVARDKAQSLFAWYGPAVPQYRIVSGSGPEVRAP